MMYLIKSGSVPGSKEGPLSYNVVSPILLITLLQAYLEGNKYILEGNIHQGDQMYVDN